MNLNELNSKELFELVLSYKNEKIISLKEILSEYKIMSFSIEELLNLLREDPEKILLIDARSEKEFSETSIPHAINFPVLTNEERHNVGLVYKKYSQSAAIKLAVEFAEPKINLLKKFLEENNAEKKTDNNKLLERRRKKFISFQNDLRSGIQIKSYIRRN
ncbi:MAG: hypothetical protein IPM38_11025 [Ignavibacteria bacterium]|nr:hypothetical protein [Ignavibacteria bacterium]